MYPVLMMTLSILTFGSLAALICITLALIGLRFWIHRSVKRKDYNGADTGARVFLYAFIAYAIDLVLFLGTLIGLGILRLG